MTSERDTARLLRTWLRDDEHESAARVVEAALAVIETTPQRRRWLPTRVIPRSVGPIVAPIAAVLLIAVIVGILYPFRGGPGTISQPTPSPSPSASPSASGGPSAPPSPTPTEPPSPESIGPSAAAFFPPDGPLPIGRAFMTRAGVSFSLEIPTDGWSSRQGFELAKGSLGTPDGLDVIFWDPSPTNIYADPCAHVPRIPPSTPPAGSRLEEVAALLAAAPNARPINDTPTDYEVDGRAAKAIQLAMPDPLPCAEYALWYESDPTAGRYPFAAGSTIWTWIVDVDGQLLWVDAETYQGAGGAVITELHQLVDSIRFE